VNRSESSEAARLTPEPQRSAVTVWTGARGQRRYSVRAVAGTTAEELDHLATLALETLDLLEQGR
jgi:hypothetical protein